MSSPFWQQVTTSQARDALAAALLHDVGHGPLSHLFEDAIPGTPHHEAWTERIILSPSTGVHGVLSALDPGMPERVAALVRGEHPLPYLAKAVSGDLRRRSMRLPAPGRARDGRRLRPVRPRLAPPQPALHADPDRRVPAGAGGRRREGAAGHRGVPLGAPLHVPAGLPAQGDASGGVDDPHGPGAARDVPRAGRPSPGVPRAIALAAHGAAFALSDYLELDDGVLGVAMRAWEDAKDPTLADLARRVRARSLFKTHRAASASRRPRADARTRARDREGRRARTRASTRTRTSGSTSRPTRRSRTMPGPRW